MCSAGSTRGPSGRGVVTGKPVSVGGSTGRLEATGRGILYIVQEATRYLGMPLEGATVAGQGFWGRRAGGGGGPPPATAPGAVAPAAEPGGAGDSPATGRGGSVRELRSQRARRRGPAPLPGDPSDGDKRPCT